MNIRRLHRSEGHRAAVYALALGQSPQHVLSAGGDGWVVEWNAADPDIGQLVASVDARIFSLCSLPELGLILAGNMDGGLHWIDRQAPNRTRNILHHRKGIFDIARIGPHIFTAGGDGLLTRWDLAAARTVESIQLSHQALRCIAVSESRAEMALGSSDGSVYFLDTETLELKHTLEKAHANSVFTAAYGPQQPDNPINQLFLTGGRDAMLRAWDFKLQTSNSEPQTPNSELRTLNSELQTSNFKLLTSRPAHWFTVNHLAFSPDGKFLATASRDKTLKIWDAATLELLKVVDTLRQSGHVNSVNRLLWLADGRLVSCGDDRTVMWWGINDGFDL
jgi:WD40 repeat protein